MLLIIGIRLQTLANLLLQELLHHDEGFGSYHTDSDSARWAQRSEGMRKSLCLSSNSDDFIALSNHQILLFLLRRKKAQQAKLRKKVVLGCGLASSSMDFFFKFHLSNTCFNNDVAGQTKAHQATLAASLTRNAKAVKWTEP